MAADWVVGADVGGTNIKFVVSPAEGPAWGRGQVATDPDDPVRSLAVLAAEVERKWPQTAGSLEAVGVACAGIVSPTTGMIGRSPNLPGWEGRPLAGMIEEAFAGLPAVVANDVNAALYGEALLGAGRGCENLVMIALGTGVGGSVMVHGRLVTGAADGAGEIGHVVLDLKGPPCSCGARGCLEAYAGSTAILRRAREVAMHEERDSGPFAELVRSRGDTLTTADISELARGGDPSAKSVLAEAGRRLGQAVAILVSVLDPERVIIGGGVAQAGEFILEPCRQVVPQLVMAEASRSVPVIAAELGPFAAALGVAALASQREAKP